LTRQHPRLSTSKEAVQHRLQRDLQKAHKRIGVLESQLARHRAESSWVTITNAVPELEHARKTFADLLLAGHPLRGRVINPDGRSSDEQPDEGAATRRHRSLLTRYKRRLGRLMQDLEFEIDNPDGGYSATADPQPRCWNSDAEHRRGLRLPRGSKMCPVCTEPLVLATSNGGG